MRIASVAIVALAGSAGCVWYSDDFDGSWSSLTVPCAPLAAEPTVVAHARGLSAYAPAGDTMLFAFEQGIAQVPIAGGEFHTVVRAYDSGEIGVVDNAIVYFESNGNAGGPAKIDVIVDRGGDTLERYQRIGRRTGVQLAALLVIDKGVYWHSSPPSEDWRWDPETNTTALFELDTLSDLRTDGTTFFYTTNAGLAVRPVAGGPQTIVVPRTNLIESALAIDGTELFYLQARPEDITDDLVVRASDGSTRVLLEDVQLDGSVLGTSYLYFSDRSRLKRAHRTTGMVDDLGATGQLFDFKRDACNVYWIRFDFSGTDTILGMALD